MAPQGLLCCKLLQIYMAVVQFRVGGCLAYLLPACFQTFCSWHAALPATARCTHMLCCWCCALGCRCVAQYGPSSYASDVGNRAGSQFDRL